MQKRDKNKRGRFVVIDGCEGAGKTTVIRELGAKFSKNGFVFTHEPGGTIFAEKIRDLVLSEKSKNISPGAMFGLFWAARSEHLEKKIIPALNVGRSVLCDRFDSSTYAYQIYAEKNPALEKLFWQTRSFYLKDGIPDMYIFLDVPPEIGLLRVENRKNGKNHFDARKLSFHRLVRSGFKSFLRKVPHREIDARQSIDKVVKDCYNSILDLTGRS